MTEFVKILHYSEDNIRREAIFSFPAQYPYEDLVDFMLFDMPDRKALRPDGDDGLQGQVSYAVSCCRKVRVLAGAWAPDGSYGTGTDGSIRTAPSGMFCLQVDMKPARPSCVHDTRFCPCIAHMGGASHGAGNMNPSCNGHILYT
nr:hypothetical protein [Komagataeibacter xylinus]